MSSTQKRRAEQDDQRFEWAKEFYDHISSTRRDLPEEVVYDAYCGVVDKLMADATYGTTRNAVFKLGRMQLGWRIADAMKRSLTPDGERRNTPVNSSSLEAPVEIAGDGGLPLGERIADPAATDPCELLVSREELRMLVDDAKRESHELAISLVMTMAGYSDAEIGEEIRIKENTVAARRSRFKRRGTDSTSGRES